jgi:hypothetical protein
VEEMLAKARSAKNSTEWTRCLIRYTQLRMALHGYETSVRFLKDQPWPEDLTGSSVLNLYYAHALTNYARSYSWEINSREKIDTKGVVDLKAWTRDQIYEEAQKAFEIVWEVRSRNRRRWKEYATITGPPPARSPTAGRCAPFQRRQPDQRMRISPESEKLIDVRSAEISLATRPPSAEKISFVADLKPMQKRTEAALEAVRNASAAAPAFH